mgnify:CR=1 FL=1
MKHYRFGVYACMHSFLSDVSYNNYWCDKLTFVVVRNSI